MLKCPKCGELFNLMHVFIPHYRHKHTDYEAALARARKALKGCKLSRLQATIMVKEEARQHIEAQIEEAVKKAVVL